MSKFNGKDGCTCQDCGTKYRADWNISDALWEAITVGQFLRTKPIEDPSRKDVCELLCGMCIAERIEALLAHEDSFAAFRVEEQP